MKKLFFKAEIEKFIGLSSYLSTLFFWYYITYSDCRNLNKREVSTFPLSLNNISENLSEKLFKLGKSLIKNLQDNSFFQEANYKKYGQLRMQVFQPRLSKPICDDIDSILGVHYLFTHEELDFIINYDIKYRMGLGKNGPNEEDE